MVTHSPSESGSMIMFHTSAGGASMQIEAVTRVIRVAAGAVRRLPYRSCCAVTDRSSSARGERFESLPLPQRMLDGGIEGVQRDAQQLRNPVVGREQIALQSLHQRNH